MIDLQKVPAQDLLAGIEGHGEAGDKEVSKGEADQEIVVDSSELPVEEDAGNDQEVGEDGHQDDQDEDTGLRQPNQIKRDVFSILKVGGVVRA